MNPNKIDIHLQNKMFATASDADSKVPVIIRHKGGMFFSKAAENVRSFNILKATALEIPREDIGPLSDNDEIEFIWADLPVHTCLEVSVSKIGAPSVWAENILGDGIKLAIVDTGIDPDHQDFAGRIVATKSFVSGADRDDNGHGTHVAGIAGGSGATSNGKYKGVAPGAHLYIAKVLDRNGGGSMSSVMGGIEWAVEQGVQVINLSLGSSGSSDGTDALSAMCEAAVENGVVVCAAAGNDGPRSSTIGSPGSAELVITIGASNDTDQITDFSSRGPTADGRVKPDLVFPGFGIVAAQASGTQLGTVVEPGYISLNGTSMATPHAAGTVCLLLQANPNLSPAQIKTILKETALNLGEPPNTQGTGRADVWSAFQQANTTPPPDPTPDPPPSPPPPKGCLPEVLANIFG